VLFNSYYLLQQFELTSVQFIAWGFAGLGRGDWRILLYEKLFMSAFLSKELSL